jgi:spore germination cell wall hydrolase CwlJ-like protein
MNLLKRYLPTINLTPKKIFSIIFLLCLIVLYYVTRSENEPTPIQQQKVVVEETSVIETEKAPEDVEAARKFEKDEINCLALNIYHESRGDSFAGQTAVSDVVMNRVSDDFYPDTVCEVVKQAVYIENWKGNVVPRRNMCQFSWYCDGSSDEPGDPISWEKSYSLARDVYVKDAWRGITEGATHYHAAHIRPNWTADRGMTYTGSIGGHEFYRWKR